MNIIKTNVPKDELDFLVYSGAIPNGIPIGKRIKAQLVEIKLARPASIYKLDPRISFESYHLDLIATKVKERIFDKGLNSFDQQTLPALSYKSPRGFYRFKEGVLFSSLILRQSGDNLILTFQYPEVILNVLEDRYGVTFLFSPSDKEYIDRVQKDLLTELGLRPLGEMDDALRNEIRTNPELAKQIEEEKRLAELIIKENNTLEKDALQQIEDEKKAYEEARARDMAERPNDTRRNVVRVPKVEQPVEREAGNLLVTHDLEYDERAVLKSVDYTEFAQQIKNRIKVFKKNAEGNDIPKSILPQILDDPTINSIEIVKPKAGILRLKVTYKDLKIPPLEREYGEVFNWSPSEISAVDAKVRLRLSGETLTNKKATQRV